MEKGVITSEKSVVTLAYMLDTRNAEIHWGF